MHENQVYLNNKTAELDKEPRKPRPSLSLSRFSDSIFEDFQESEAEVRGGADVMINIVSIILVCVGIGFGTKCSIRNLQPLGDGIPSASTGVYYGARPEQLDGQVRYPVRKARQANSTKVLRSKWARWISCSCKTTSLV